MIRDGECACGGKTRVAPRSVADRIESFERLLRARELAPLLGINSKTIYAQAASGAIPSLKLAGSLRFDSFTVAAWLRAKAA